VITATTLRSTFRKAATTAGLSVIVLLAVQLRGAAQVNPPRPVSVQVSTTQHLRFGAFFQGAAGGTVIVYANGTRTTTGTVIPANFGAIYSPALFEVDAEPGTVITISVAGPVVLSGSNGGTMELDLDDISPASPFVTTAVPPARTPVYIGGTLTVDDQTGSPPGEYSGTFNVIFFQQ